ncbi:1621_t:CDS:10 [Paraglomus brasilianum]|uniref:1621_t:CDS:1 n=1 Tax=Paraglomus brasilianum TaxID=144538 RepID=A0A9N9F4A1_9GLOM|nr:1621_t:CDS:10 [Paraglomus brasilianum]
MIVIFILDTSVSMNRRFADNLSAFECAKSGIETFFKEMNDEKNRWFYADRVDKVDKYVLVTYENGDGRVKSSLKDGSEKLLAQLKMLKAQDMSNPAAAFAAALEILDAYRLSMGMDTICRGRYPAPVNNSLILWFTDGGDCTDVEDLRDRTVREKLKNIELNTPGVHLYNEPLRWDQKLYTFILESDESPTAQYIQEFTENVRGKLYRIYDSRMMVQQIASMVETDRTDRARPRGDRIFTNEGVLVNFQEMRGGITTPNDKNHRKFLFVEKNGLSGEVPYIIADNAWCIPENFWVPRESLGSIRMSKRNYLPTIFYEACDRRFHIPQGIVYEQFRVEKCEMTTELMRSGIGTQWPVYIKDSGGDSRRAFGEPFGFLAASENRVYLVVLPYNYPALFGLLEKYNPLPYIDVNRMSPEWVKSMKNYMESIPWYYHERLRNNMPSYAQLIQAFSPLNIRTDELDAYISEIKKSANEWLERLDGRVKAAALAPVAAEKKISLYEDSSNVPRSLLVSTMTQLKRAFFKEIGAQGVNGTIGRNKINDTSDEDTRHSLPVSQMGEYHAAMQKQFASMLRNPYEFDDMDRKRARRYTVGNNMYRSNTNEGISIDEAGEASPNIRASNEAEVPNTSPSNGLAPSASPRKWRHIEPQYIDTQVMFNGIPEAGIPALSIKLRREKLTVAKKGQRRNLMLEARSSTTIAASESQSLTLKNASVDERIELPGAHLHFSMPAVESLSLHVPWDGRTESKESDNDNNESRGILTAPANAGFAAVPMQDNGESSSQVIPAVAPNGVDNKTNNTITTTVHQQEEVELMDVDEEEGELKQEAEVEEIVNRTATIFSQKDEGKTIEAANRIFEDGEIPTGVDIDSEMELSDLNTVNGNATNIGVEVIDQNSREDSSISVDSISGLLLDAKRKLMEIIKSDRTDDSINRISDIIRDLESSNDYTKEQVAAFIRSLRILALGSERKDVVRQLQTLLDKSYSNTHKRTTPVSDSMSSADRYLYNNENSYHPVLPAVNWLIEEIKKEDYDESNIKNKLLEVEEESKYSQEQKKSLVIMALRVATGSSKSQLIRWLQDMRQRLDGS